MTQNGSPFRLAVVAGTKHPLRFVIGDLQQKPVKRLPLPPLSEEAVVTLARRGWASRGDEIPGGIRSSSLKYWQVRHKCAHLSPCATQCLRVLRACRLRKSRA